MGACLRTGTQIETRRSVAIPLNKELVRALIKRRFQSVGELVVEWEERVRAGSQKVGRARDSKTIYRWIERGLPSRRSDIFGFASVLDVDPVAIVDINDTFIQKHFGKERRLFQVGLANLSLLSPFWPLYVPSQMWPNDEIANSFYGRSWFTQDFAHDPTVVANVYAAVRLTTTANDDPAIPRAYHFAYRRSSAHDGMWRPYGTVIGMQNKVRLISENGDYQELADERSSSEVVAETYFGPGPAEFRIAALHAFAASVEVPVVDPKSVRFVG